LTAGLVDELVPLDQVLDKAEAKMRNYMKADQEILVATKSKIRKHLLGKLDLNGKSSLKEAATLWWKPEIRAKMEAYVQSFSNKKKV